MERAIQNSLCFGLFQGSDQIGFARVVTDRAMFGYVADVYGLEEYRGRGLATWLIECVCSHPELQGLRRFGLATRDAHELYRKFGFTQLADPAKHGETRRNTAKHGETRRNTAKHAKHSETHGDFSSGNF